MRGESSGQRAESFGQLSASQAAHRYSIMNLALAHQLERIRAMSADEKVRISHALWLEAREVLAAGVRAQFPASTDAQAADRVREVMRDAGA